MSGGSRSPLIVKRGRCRSPGLSSKVSASTTTPGTRCLVFLRRCLAIQLQKVGSFPNNSSTTTTSTTTSCTNGHFDGTVERDAPLYWMYDSGYLIFQGFLEANLKCFWNGALMEAMKVMEFQGYIAPGVLLVSGSPCALEVVRAAWARNVLKPPNNYVITVVGDVEDCLVEPISQGQFTPLPEALCWIILDMTASGQAAVMESICSTLEVAFPDIQKPSKQLIYDTLAKLMAEKKLYQTSNGYFVMTPDKMRLSGLTTNKKESCDTFSNSHQKQILLTPEEAVVMMHGEIETVRDGNITHQAIQTNLADVICGGNSNDKVLYPRVPARIRSGYSAERLERRHSLRFFGHGRRSHSLQRTGSVRHISDKNEKVHISKDVPSDEASRKHTSLFSRLFRRSGRMRRDESPSSTTRPTFSAQFPPSEWFNRGVTHLHSVGTQTTYLAPSTDTLPKRRFDYDSDDILLHELQQHRKRISTLGTPRTIRRAAHSSATLPRRSLKKTSPSVATSYGDGGLGSSCDKDTTTANTSPVSRISSQNSVASPTLASSHNNVCPSSAPCSGGSHSSLASSKTVISKEQPPSKRASPTHKSMSSASSGYNSLPRSVSSVRHSKNAAAAAAGKSHAAVERPAAAGSAARSGKTCSGSKSKERCAENSITFHMSAKSSSSSTSTGCEAAAMCGGVAGCSPSTARRSTGGGAAATTKTERSATTMTINGGNKTKIFVQQQHHNTPTRSLITFENSVGDKTEPNQAADIIIVNQPHDCAKNGAAGCAEAKAKPIRPSSLYVQQQQNNVGRKSHRSQRRAAAEHSARLLETHLKARFPSSEAIQLEEKLLEAAESRKPNNRRSNVNVLDDLQAAKEAAAKSGCNSLALGSSETELNNAKNYLLSHNSNAEKLNNVRHKNVLTKSVKDDKDVVNSEPTSPMIEHHISKLNDSKATCKEFNVDKELENLSLDDTKLKQYAQFPSLGDLSLRFTSLAAQSILKGVSYNSVDTLVEVNMAAEKKRNCEMNINTDLGVV